MVPALFDFHVSVNSRVTLSLRQSRRCASANPIVVGSAVQSSLPCVGLGSVPVGSPWFVVRWNTRALNGHVASSVHRHYRFPNETRDNACCPKVCLHHRSSSSSSTVGIVNTFISPSASKRSVGRRNKKNTHRSIYRYDVH